MLVWLEAQIIEDQHTLDAMMEGLAVAQTPVKTALGVVGERVGRLKLNGRLRHRSPLSTIVELEALAAAVLTKSNLWRSLQAADQPGTDPGLLAELIQRAANQLEAIEHHHDAAARHVFESRPTTAAVPTVGADADFER
jgi:hypothetical protein